MRSKVLWFGRALAVGRQSAICCVALVLACATISPANGQLRSELRDPVRGVSFYSMEISDEAIADLEVKQGSFSSSDRLTFGISAMVFDGESAVDNYIIWLRHEGRSWLDSELMANSVRVVADGTSLSLQPLRLPQRFSRSGPLVYEKLELQAAPSEVALLGQAESATVILVTEDGHVEKPLAKEELGQIRSFLDSIEEVSAPATGR